MNPDKNVDLSTFRSCRKTLKEHINRSNYQSGIWKREDENFPEVPKAEDHGWVVEDTLLVPLWCKESVLPTSVVDLMENMDSVEEEEECNLEEVDSDDSIDDDYLYDYLLELINIHFVSDNTYLTKDSKVQRGVQVLTATLTDLICR